MFHVLTPIAVLGINCDESAVTRIDFLPVDTAPLLLPTTTLEQQVAEELQHYLQQPQHSLNVPVRLGGTPFQQRVWQAMSAIPAGQTITYAELAHRVGSGPRAVANACGANPVPIVVPCHRIVARDGLGGFMQGRANDSLNIKRWLLAHERG